jgi:hypothetical protein
MAKKFKVPKKIAGVKVPKQLRRDDHHPGHRELAAAALIAVAGALLSNKKVRSTLAAAGEKAAKEGAKAANKAATKARSVAKDATRSALEAAESTAKSLANKLDKGSAASAARKARNSVESATH